MFFDDPTKIYDLAHREAVTIFTVAPNPTDIKPFFTLAPGKNGKITIDQARELIALTDKKQTIDRFILIKNAETIEPAAENAILKLLEEPKAHYHFMIITKEPHALLPTILSRAKLYIFREENPLEKPPEVDKKTLELAKKLLVVRKADLPALADEIAKNKRDEALKVVSASIELAYKSYFATNKPIFLKKIPNLLKLYQNLKGNGHLKLHIVADML